MRKVEFKRDKKRAELSEQSVGDDLLSAVSATQVSALTSGADETLLASPVVPKTSDQEPSQEEMHQENFSEAKQEIPTATPSAGALLKEAREAAGFSIDEVSRLLKLAPRQIQALEQQNFTDLPPRTFVRGFIRNYARLLNIDADDVLETLPPESLQTPSPAASSVNLSTRDMPVLSPYGERTIRQRIWWWLLAVAILVAMVAFFFFWPKMTALLLEDEIAAVAEELNAPFVWPESENVHTMTPIIMPLSEAPTSAGPLVAPITEATTLTGKENEEAALVLRFTGDSWVEVRDRHDKILYFALEKSGTEKNVLGAPPFSLVLGNSDAVTVMLHGKTIDLSGHSKQGVARLTLE